MRASEGACVLALVLIVGCGGPQDVKSDVAPATEEALTADLAEIERLLNEARRVETEILPILDLASEAAERETVAHKKQIRRAILVCGGEASEPPESRPSALLTGVVGESSSVTCIYEQLASNRVPVAPSSLVATGTNPLQIEVRRPLYIAPSGRLDELLAPAREAHQLLDEFVTREVAAIPLRGAPETPEARALAEKVQLARDELQGRISGLRPNATRVHADLVVIPDIKDRLDVVAVTLGELTGTPGQYVRLVVRPDGIEADAYVPDERTVKKLRALADKNPVTFGTLEVAAEGPVALPTWPEATRAQPGRRLEVRANGADAHALLTTLWNRKSTLLRVGGDELVVSGQASGSNRELWSRLMAVEPGLASAVTELPKGRGKSVSLQLIDARADALGAVLADVLGRNVAVAAAGPRISVAASNVPADSVLAGIAMASPLRLRLHDGLYTLTARDELPSIDAPRAGRLDFFVVDATAGESLGFLSVLTKAELTAPCDQGDKVHLRLRAVSPRAAARGVQVASGVDPARGAPGPCAPVAWDQDVVPTQRTVQLIGISEGQGAAALVRLRSGGGTRLIRDGDRLPGGMKARVGAGRLEIYRAETFVEGFGLTLGTPFRPTAAYRLTATVSGGDHGYALFRGPDGETASVHSGFLTDGDSMTIEPGRVELRYETEIEGRTESVVARWRL